jgi:bacillopeptidase F
MNKYFILCIIILLSCILLGPGSLLGGSISRSLTDRMSTSLQNEQVDILITFKDQPDVQALRSGTTSKKRVLDFTTLKKAAEKSQQQLRNMLLAENGQQIRSLWIINGLAAQVPLRLVEEIARQPGVLRVSLDAVVRLPETGAAISTATSTWNIDLTGADQFWQQGHDGDGVVVAVVDTGVDLQHQDLQSRWRGGNNSWYDPNGEHATPYDHDGHGTRVAGIILGGDAGGSAIGMSPGASWIAVKIFDDANEAAYSDIHLGFQWLLDPDNNSFTNDLPDIINNSWGLNELTGQCLTEFQPDIQLLRASGIVVNFSAGNAGPAANTSISPANNPGSFAVGGVDSSIQVTNFSSRGPSPCNGTIYPHILAPAVDIRTSDITFGGLFPDNYAVVDGTSFAAPHVTGAMALIKSGYPWLQNDELQQVLTLSAQDIETPGPDNTAGHGVLDLAAAMNLLDANTCISPDGTFYFDPDGCGQSFQPKNRHIPAIIHLLLNAVFHGNFDGFLLSHFSSLSNAHS